LEGDLQMPINFHDENNRQTYATRNADAAWKALMLDTITVSNKQIADIGCGGGIYTKALIEMGAAHVTGVDFSAEMLKGAAANCQHMANVTFLQGDAYQSNLPANSLDMILERALIHHLKDLDACFKEAFRVLKNGGVFIIQDRTPNDCLMPGEENHIRGYFFEKFPQLARKEVARRYESEQVQQALQSNGFQIIKIESLWETRYIYNEFEQLERDLLLRTGRSILHELGDAELQELVSFLKQKLNHCQPPIIEKDLWTIWFAVKADD